MFPKYPVILAFIIMLLCNGCPWNKRVAQAKAAENQQTVLKDYIYGCK